MTFAAVEDVEQALVGVGYLPDRGLATAAHTRATTCSGTPGSRARTISASRSRLG